MIDFDLHTVRVITVALLTGGGVFFAVLALLNIVDPPHRYEGEPLPDLKPNLRSVQ